MIEDFLLENKKVWIAGHTGMVGSALCRRLKNENCELLKVSRHELDLSDTLSVKSWIEVNKPDVIFLAAAKVGGILFNSNYPADFITENLEIQTNVIKYAHCFGVKKLIFLGSACVYPISEEPISEDLLLNGQLEETNRAYAIAKIAGIEMCQAYRKQYKSNFISVQPNNLYGLNDNFSDKNSHVIPALIRRIHEAKVNENNEVIIWGSGKPLREFLNVDDCADALVTILRKYNHIDPINIGSGEEVSISKLAHLIAKVINYKGRLVFDSKFPDGVPRKFLDNSKLRELGWQSQTKLEVGLKKTYNWFLHNIDNG